VGARRVGSDAGHRSRRGHWKTIAFVAALGLCGLTAPSGGFAVGSPRGDGARRADERPRLAYVQQGLVPTLWPGQTVVMANLPARKVAGVRAAIQAASARLWLLPPYSPDFNPVENAFAKLKATLRKAAARTIPSLWDAIRGALPQFTPDECANLLKAAGHQPE
jgi:transposase